MASPMPLPRVQFLLSPPHSEVTQRSLKMRSRCWPKSLSRKQREKEFPQQPRSVLLGLGLGELLIRDQAPGPGGPPGPS